MANHDITGLPMTADGWTDLIALVQNPTLYNTSRIIYVSSTGNDGTGTSYAKGATEIGVNQSLRLDRPELAGLMKMMTARLVKVTFA